MDEGENTAVFVNVEHDRSEVVIDSLETSLFPRQRSTAKYGFKVHPSTLDLVQVVKVFVEVCKPRLPESCLVSKSFKVGRVLERLEQTLVVSDLINEQRHVV